MISPFSKWKRDVEFAPHAFSACANPYAHDPTENVTWARITGPWHPKMPNYFRRNGATGVRMVNLPDAQAGGLEFLSTLPFLSALHLGPLHKDAPAVLPLHQMSDLRRLSLQTKTASSIPFDDLPALQSLTCSWAPGMRGLFARSDLKRLQLSSLSKKETERLAGLTELRNLELSHSGITNFAPIAELTELTILTLSVCHGLESLNGIEQLRNLKALHLSEVHCVTSLEILAHLPQLEVLVISDGRDIESIAPLEALKNLKALWIAGAKTKILDGDLTPITRLPKLAMLSLTARRHYSHKAIRPWNWRDVDNPDRLLSRN